MVSAHYRGFHNGSLSPQSTSGFGIQRFIEVEFQKLHVSVLKTTCHDNFMMVGNLEKIHYINTSKAGKIYFNCYSLIHRFELKLGLCDKPSECDFYN